jgi:hypothetical protein
MRKSWLITLSLLSAVAFSTLVAGLSQGADHRDAPNLTFFPASGPNHPNPELRSLDLNDVYLFRSPANPSNTVMAMTVNPFAIPGETVFFSSQGTYEFVINNASDTSATPLLRPEITFRCNFTAPRAGRQEIRLTKVNHITNRSELIARGQTGSDIAIRGGGQVRADVFDDPFFFDFRAFQGDRDGPEGMAFGPGSRNFNDEFKFDFFAGANTGVIVLEVPTSTLVGGTGMGSNIISLWSRTLDGSGSQVDRTAIPAVNTVLIRPNRFIGPFPGTPNPNAPAAPNFKNQFNLTLPVNDRAVWGDEARRSLGVVPANPDATPPTPQRGFGSSPERAAAIANLLLPDILTFDTTLPVGSGFVPGLNGRRLEDDVIDFELQVVLDNNAATDGVSHGPFRTRWPYFLPRN